MVQLCKTTVMISWFTNIFFLCIQSCGLAPKVNTANTAQIWGKELNFSPNKPAFKKIFNWFWVMRVESAFNYSLRLYKFYGTQNITLDNEQARQKAAGLLNPKLFVELTVRKISIFFPPTGQIAMRDTRREKKWNLGWDFFFKELHLKREQKQNKKTCQKSLLGYVQFSKSPWYQKSGFCFQSCCYVCSPHCQFLEIALLTRQMWASLGFSWPQRTQVSWKCSVWSNGK